ncbi:MAG: DUF4386 domain-containing protein [Leptospiraceae bacterium]
MRKLSIVFGVLLILGIVCGVFSSVLALEQPDYLSTLVGISVQVYIAVFFQATMAVVYVLIATVLYPVFRERQPVLAVIHTGFRLVGSAFLFAGIASLLLLLLVSESYVNASVENHAYHETLGQILRAGRDWLNHVAMILPWSIGGIFLYYLFLQSELIPVWLSIWGLIASGLTVLATVLLMLNMIQIVSTAYMVMNAPTAILEVTLAMYLFIKGFKSIDHE